MDVEPIQVELPFIVGAMMSCNRRALEKIPNMSSFDLEYVRVCYSETRSLARPLCVEIHWKDFEEVLVETIFLLSQQSSIPLSIRNKTVWVSLQTIKGGDFFNLIFSNTEPKLQEAA